MQKKQPPLTVSHLRPAEASVIRWPHKVVSGLLIKHEVHCGDAALNRERDRERKAQKTFPLMSPSISITSGVHVSCHRKISHLQIMTSPSTKRNTEGKKGGTF